MKSLPSVLPEHSISLNVFGWQQKAYQLIFLNSEQLWHCCGIFAILVLSLYFVTFLLTNLLLTVISSTDLLM